MNLLMALSAAAFVAVAGVMRLAGANATLALAAGGAAAIATGAWLSAVGG